MGDVDEDAPHLLFAVSYRVRLEVILPELGPVLCDQFFRVDGGGESQISLVADDAAAGEQCWR